MYLEAAQKVSFMGNQVYQTTAVNGVKLSYVPVVDMQDNMFLNIDQLDFCLNAATPYEVASGGIWAVGPNFWGSADWKLVESKIFDSHDDASLVVVTQEMIYADENLQTTLSAPVLQQCHDSTTRTAGCTITNADTVYTIPQGLYYAPESLVVRHPDAELILEAGVRIMFAPEASLRVDQGLLRVLGSETNPVELSSTDWLALEYGDSSIPVSSEWGGVYFGPSATGASFTSGVYAHGAILQGCTIVDAGFLADTTAVMLQGVHVNGTNERFNSGIGIEFKNAAAGLVLLDDVQVEHSAGIGIQFYHPAADVELHAVSVSHAADIGLNSYRGSILLDMVNVTNCSKEGVKLHEPLHVSIADSYFKSNSQGLQADVEVWLLDLQGQAIVTSR